ncbi:hypothetical protein DID88_005154 [Monilinia fructigena]|uniref:Uncharacterized protein n=1 Tax=Monilinia fructigena TaxID=38457 RepID=A0A395IE28_9HELO|nr:hypothetical protein DID88_005154 [Monilinia fructigena]
MVKRHCIELGSRIEVPAKDAELPQFYNCTERIMTKGILIPDSIQFVDIYFDIDIKTEALKLLPIDICIPNEDAKTYTSENRLWNFTSEYKTIDIIDVALAIGNIDINILRKIAIKNLHRL